MDINTQSKDNTKKGWKQLWMMFEGEDHQAPQTLTDNGTITTEDPETPITVLDTIKSIKEEEHFWHYHSKILLDLRYTHTK